MKKWKMPVKDPPLKYSPATPVPTFQRTTLSVLAWLWGCGLSNEITKLVKIPPYSTGFWVYAIGSPLLSGLLSYHLLRPSYYY